MKKYTQAYSSGTVVFVLCLVLFLSAGSVFAQGFTGPQAVSTQQVVFPAQQGFAGFTGPVQTVTVLQVAQTFPNKAQAILRGNIVMSLGGDRYLFRDSTSEFVIKIKHDRWWGLTVGPEDLIEIGGELKRDRRTAQINYFDAKSIRRAL